MDALPLQRLPLTAADAVIIPLQCEYYALEGLARLLDTIERIRRGLNPRLEVEGIVLTMMDLRVNLCRQVESEVREHFGDRVFEDRPRSGHLAFRQKRFAPQHVGACRGPAHQQGGLRLGRLWLAPGAPRDDRKQRHEGCRTQNDPPRATHDTSARA